MVHFSEQLARTRESQQIDPHCFLWIGIGCKVSLKGSKKGIAKENTLTVCAFFPCMQGLCEKF